MRAPPRPFHMSAPDGGGGGSPGPPPRPAALGRLGASFSKLQSAATDGAAR